MTQERLQQKLQARFASIAAARWWDALALALIVMPLILQVWLIYRLGVNVPIQDDWIYLPFVRRVAQGAEWVSWLWRQHNENRYVIVSLVIAANTFLTGWNVVAQMALGLVPTALTLRGVWLIYGRAGNTSLWLFVPIAWLLIHWSQYHNYLFGLQIGFLCAVCGVVWTAYFLNRNTGRFFLLALGCAIFSTISAASGLFVWWMGLAQLGGQRAPRRLVAVWMGVAVVVYGSYFFGYTPTRTSAALSATLRDPLHMAQFGLTLVGAALGTNQVVLSQLLGIGLLLALGALLVYMGRARRFPRNGEWGAVGLIVFALVVSAVITVGRGHNKLEDALTARYISLTVLAVIGLYILFVARLTPLSGARRWAGVIVPVLLVGLVATNAIGWGNAVEWSRTYGRMNKFIIQTQDLTNRAVAKNLLGKKQLLSRLGDLEYMREHRLSSFRDPVEWWLILPRAKSKALAAPGADAKVAQTFRCPVQTLYDVSLVLQNDKLPEAGTVDLELSEMDSSTVLAARAVDMRGPAKSARVFLVLAEPVNECLGKELRLEISAAQESTSGGVTVLRYPTMYEGMLFQGDREIPGASLGIELNARRFDIRDGQ